MHHPVADLFKHEDKRPRTVEETLAYNFIIIIEISWFDCETVYTDTDTITGCLLFTLAVNHPDTLFFKIYQNFHEKTQTISANPPPPFYFEPG